MKRKTKFGLGIATLAIGVLALSGCTASFCSTTDKAHIAAAYTYGVVKYYEKSNIDTTDANNLKVLGTNEKAYELTTVAGIENVYFTYSYANNKDGELYHTNEKALSSNIGFPNNYEYWASMDLVLLEKAYTKAGSPAIDSAEKVNKLVFDYGYLRYDSSNNDTDKLWDDWSTFDVEARQNMVSKYNVYDITFNADKLPSSDYIALYKNVLNQAINSYRGCITTSDTYAGNYGWSNDDKVEVAIEGKSYGYAWGRGPLEGFLVYPIGALIDVMCNAFSSLGNGLNGTNGWAQLLTILLVTLIVRAFMFAVSFKSTIGNARMAELQPQIAKIQAKYPNANTSQAEKARMSDEMNKLYKKNGINPFSSLIVMVFQFPIFICVWGAFTGSAWLSTGQFLGMNFSDSISAILFNASSWANGSAWTALVLFLLMAGSQVLSMLIPQIIQKRKQKNVQKLGKNPAATQQGKTMKIVTYIMMAMVIFMGFSLASAMGVYWFIGALISIAQTLITQKIIARKGSKEKR